MSLLRAPSQQTLEVLAIAFTVYHALKLGHSTEVASAIWSSDYREVGCIAAQVAAGTAVKFGFVSHSLALPPIVLIDSADNRMHSEDNLTSREFCELGYSEFALGAHHPCCSQAILATENLRDQLQVHAMSMV